MASVSVDRTTALKAGARTDSGWRSELDRRFRELAEAASLQYQRELTTVRVMAEEWASQADTATATQIAHDFDAGLQAIWADVVTRVTQGVLDIAAALPASSARRGSTCSTPKSRTPSSVPFRGAGVRRGQRGNGRGVSCPGLPA